MLDEKKIRLMTKLARYEQNQGKEDLRIGRYYRSDFIGAALLKNFVLTTIGYGAVAALFFACQGDDFLEKLDFAHLIIMLIVAVAGYIIALVCYSGATYMIYSIKYSRAQKDIRAYDAKLAVLQKYYGKDMQPEKRQDNGRTDV